MVGGVCVRVCAGGKGVFNFLFNIGCGSAFGNHQGSSHFVSFLTSKDPLALLMP